MGCVSRFLTCRLERQNSGWIFGAIECIQWDLLIAQQCIVNLSLCFDCFRFACVIARLIFTTFRRCMSGAAAIAGSSASRLLRFVGCVVSVRLFVVRIGYFFGTLQIDIGWFHFHCDATFIANYHLQRKMREKKKTLKRMHFNEMWHRICCIYLFVVRHWFVGWVNFGTGLHEIFVSFQMAK